MADLAITAANVSIPSSAIPYQSVAGEAIDAGELIYIDTSDQSAKLAVANSTSAEATVSGIAVCSAASGQRVLWVYRDDTVVTIDSVATQGTAYFLSETAGKLCPLADLTTDSFVSYVCTASAATTLVLGIHNTGVQVP